MSIFSIKSIEAHEILDSRGDPTLMTAVTLSGGAIGRAGVPSGASLGRFEAHELRDNDAKRYAGKGVLKACNNVNIKIAHALFGHNAEDQAAIDRRMINLDGRSNKSNLGANAILSVSLATAKAVSVARKMPLYRSLRQTYNLEHQPLKLPTPLMNIVNGGKHASTNIALQEFQIIPVINNQFNRQLEAGSEIFHELGKLLTEQGLDSDVGSEGGYAPNVETLEQALDLIMPAIIRAGYKPGENVYLGLDAAANSFYEERSQIYTIAPPPRALSADGMRDFYATWIKDYPFLSIEDPFAEEAWYDWRRFTAQHGEHLMVIGDDLFATNVNRIEKGIEQAAANAVLIKPNQIGTLSETMAAIKLTQAQSWKVVISHRSGETNDTTIADLAVAAGADYIKAGAPDRGERVAKYNRLLEIERELFESNS